MWGKSIFKFTKLLFLIAMLSNPETYLKVVPGHFKEKTES